MVNPATWTAFVHSAVYTGGTLLPAFALGLVAALLFHRAFPARRWLRSLLLLPWAVPGVIVSISFLWMFDASFGVVNSILRRLGLLSTDLAWFVDADTAMIAGDPADRVEELPVLRDHACSPRCSRYRRRCTKRRASTAPAPGSSSCT